MLCKGGCDGVVTLNKSSVDVCEFEKSLEFFDGGCKGPGMDGFHLVVGTDIIAKELDGGLVEGKFSP